jgi:excisionase family DNA binding protein
MPRKKKLEERIYPEILNMDELRSFLRVSYDTALRLITTGQIPAKRINREWRINKQDVLNYISSGANQ